MTSEGLKIIDLLKDEKPYDFEESGCILITGITESTLNDAITIAESARESGVVTVGIPEGNIYSGNEDMRRFSDIADAVIFSREESDISHRIAEEISAITERDGDISTVTAIFRNAGTEKSFFVACLRFGTLELVRKFISKGYNPKELEINGIFPGDVLADCPRKT